MEETPTGKETKHVDCVLIYPYLEDANWKNELRSKDNLALGYLASCARQAGYSVKMIHAEHNKYSPDDIKKLIGEYSPKVVGISVTAQRAYPVAKQYSEKIKSISDAPVFLGGIFPTIAWEPVLEDCPNVDAVCLGEGEKFIVDYLDSIVNGRTDFRNISGIAYRDDNGIPVKNGVQNVIHDLDALPLPAKDFFDNMKAEIASGFYYAHISAGRGCYGNCSFCSMSGLSGKNKRRVRSPQSVVSEIKHLQKKYGINCFYFVDELFIDKTNLQWIYDFCDEMKKQEVKILFHAEARVDSIIEPVLAALKEVGLDNLFIGFESGNKVILDRYRKGHTPEKAEQAMNILNKLDITVEYGYIMIDPDLSFDQLEDNVKWILKIGNHTKHNLYNKLNLYYGTDLYKAIKERSRDGLPFYERKISSFKDPSVAAFSACIDESKEIFGDYNERVNSYILGKVKEYKSNENWQRTAEKINDFEIVVWEDIILSALDHARNSKGVDEVWRSYIEEHVSVLNGKLDDLMKDNLENDSHDEGQSTMRFKPL